MDDKKKVGAKPKGVRAMTDAERQVAYMERRKAEGKVPLRALVAKATKAEIAARMEAGGLTAGEVIDRALKRK